MSFWAIWQPLGAVVSLIFGSFRRLFSLPQAKHVRLLKFMNFVDSIALFEVFHGPRGLQHRFKMGPKAACSGNLAPRELGRLLKLDFGSFWAPSWSPKYAQRGLANRTELWTDFGGPRDGARTGEDAPPLG